MPDLASTLLNAADAEFQAVDSRGSRPRRTAAQVVSRTEDAWDGRTVVRLSRDDDVDDDDDNDNRSNHRSGSIINNLLERPRADSASRSSYLTDSEFPHWLSESDRRVMMQSQRSRRRDQDRPSQNYATSGMGPQRQSLYDWAVTGREASLSDDSGDDDEDTPSAMTTYPEGASRTELERALRNYRVARNALRSGRASDLGAVPTASALRAYWNEEAGENGASARLSSFTLGEFVEQHRLERQRRHAELIRFQGDRERRGAQGAHSHLTALRERRASEAFSRVRNTIRYLSELRHTTVQGGLELAGRLCLDALYESEESTVASDLPMHIDSLPLPQYSSWLQPGMVWHGLQSTDKEPAQPPTLASTLRRERQREYLRRAMARRGFGADSIDVGPPSGAGALLDAERYLSDLLQDSNGRWGFSQSESPPSRSLSTHLYTTSSQPHSPEAADHWPVSVTLHSVDYSTMTLTGTMSASHIPDKVSLMTAGSSRPCSDPFNPGTSMCSFFTGEIIDFRQHPLETEPEGRTYRVGGLDVDARYWRRLGPFRQEIDQAATASTSYATPWTAKNSTSGKSVYDKDDFSKVDGSSGGGATSEGIKEAEADEIMARCVGSRRWLDGKLAREWILMRWKERCFVSPPSGSSNLTTSPAIITTATSIVHGDMSSSSSPTTSQWGLTISGFYYVALNRLSGHIDGLYYDPGSQPYQQLKMVPGSMPLEGMGLESMTVSHSARAPRASGIISPAGGGKLQVEGGRGGGAEGGVKKWFPSVEFR